jgi:hypothetical protein
MAPNKKHPTLSDDQVAQFKAVFDVFVRFLQLHCVQLESYIIS